jgi:hypothetical protein
MRPRRRSSETFSKWPSPVNSVFARDVLANKRQLLPQFVQETFRGCYETIREAQISHWHYSRVADRPGKYEIRIYPNHARLITLTQFGDPSILTS